MWKLGQQGSALTADAPIAQGCPAPAMHHSSENLGDCVEPSSVLSWSEPLQENHNVQVILTAIVVLIDAPKYFQMHLPKSTTAGSSVKEWCHEAVPYALTEFPMEPGFTCCYFFWWLMLSISLSPHLAECCSAMVSRKWGLSSSFSPCCFILDSFSALTNWGKI